MKKKIIAGFVIGSIALSGACLAACTPQEKTYSIDLNSNIERAAFDGNGLYKLGQEVTLEAEPVDGYRFVCWMLNEQPVAETNPYTFILSEENVGTYTAVYEKEYVVTVVSTFENGEPMLSKIKALKGELIDLTNQNYDHYEIDKLYYVEDGKTEKVNVANLKFIMPEVDITLYAQYKQTRNNVLKDELENGDISFSNNYAVYGEEISVNITPDEHYELAELYYIVNGTTEKIEIVDNKFLMPEKDVTVYAVFDKIQYFINQVVGPNGTIELSKNKAGFEDEVLITVVPDEHYDVDQLYYTIGEGDEGNAVTNNSIIMPADDVTIYVSFKLKTYEIEKAETQHGEIEISTQSSVYDAEITINIIPDEHYELSELYYIEQGDTEHIAIEDNKFKNPGADLTVYAVFSKIQYTIDKVVGNNGMLDLSKSAAGIDDEIEVVVTPNEHYVLDELYYVIEGTDEHVIIQNDFIINPGTNITVYASFKLKEYSLSIPKNVVVTRGGSELTSESVVCYGYILQIVPEEKEGYNTYVMVTGAERDGDTNSYLVCGDVEIEYFQEFIPVDYQANSTIVFKFDEENKTAAVMANIGNLPSGELVIPEKIIKDEQIYIVDRVDGSMLDIMTGGMVGFYNCTGLTSVILPATIQTIGDYAFVGCTNLQNLTFSSSVKKLGMSAVEIDNNDDTYQLKQLKSDGYGIYLASDENDYFALVGMKLDGDEGALCDLEVDYIVKHEDTEFIALLLSNSEIADAYISSLSEEELMTLTQQYNVARPIYFDDPGFVIDYMINHDSTETIKNLLMMGTVNKYINLLSESQEQNLHAEYEENLNSYDSFEDFVADYIVNNNLNSDLIRLLLDNYDFVRAYINSMSSDTKEDFELAYGDTAHGLKDYNFIANYILNKESPRKIDELLKECSSQISAIYMNIASDQKKENLLSWVQQLVGKINIPAETKIVVGQMGSEFGDEGAFSNCTGFIVDEKNPYFIAGEDGVLYSKDGKTLVFYPGGKTDARFVVPEGVEVIGQGAFTYCPHLEEIVLPSTLKEIQDYAFYLTESINGDLVIPEGVETIGGLVFLSNINSRLHIPSTIKSVGKGAFAAEINSVFIDSEFVYKNARELDFDDFDNAGNILAQKKFIYVLATLVEKSTNEVLSNSELFTRSAELETINGKEYWKFTRNN